MYTGAPAGFFAGGGAKPGTIAPIFFCYVWMPCCIPDPTVYNTVNFIAGLYKIDDPILLILLSPIIIWT